MAFQFPDPNVTAEFTGDNGITYSWDAIDGKWQIKRYAADFDDRYVNEKGGDTMEGPSPLVFKTKETGFNYNSPPTNTSYLKFLNDKNGSITSVNLWLGGNVNTLTTDQSFMARGGIYTKEYYYAYGTSSTSLPRIRLQSNTGSLQSSSTVALSWDSTGVKKILAKGSEGSSGYVLRLDSNKVPYWSSPPMPTYTITKSNGNYYVQ